jgi:hypothetical protein
LEAVAVQVDDDDCIEPPPPAEAGNEPIAAGFGVFSAGGRADPIEYRVDQQAPPAEQHRRVTDRLQCKAPVFA